LLATDELLIILGRTTRGIDLSDMVHRERMVGQRGRRRQRR
jgi:hypothetical protein